MSGQLRLLSLMAISAVALAAPACAADLKMIGTMPVGGMPLAAFDISFVDQPSERYFLADSSNGTVDIFDAKTSKPIGSVGGFVGRFIQNGAAVGSKSGPSGVLAFDDQVWGGDGDSTAKVVDLKTMKVVDTIATGGTTRLDEMAYDPVDGVFIGVNNAETPPFATLISTKPGHKVIAKLLFSDATGGAEQPDYNAADGMFYVALPELSKQVGKGGVAVIDPKTGMLVKMLTVDNCRPNGLAFGPNQNFLLGCSANGGANGLPPVTVIMNAKTGSVVATVPGLGGSDEVAYSAKNGQYYTATSNQPGGPVLGVIDAKTNMLVQKVAMNGGGPHSVAVDETTGHVFVPASTANGGCGCIQVYAPQ